VKTKNGVIKIYGSLFLAIGFLWLAAIYIRCEASSCEGKARTVLSYQNLQQKLTQRLIREYPNAKTFPLHKYVPKMVIAQFWAIAVLELICALLVLITGIALWRGYPKKSHFVMVAITADITLKTLIVTYQRCLLLPLSKIFDEKNILMMYFAPDAAAVSKVSSYLAGIRLIQPGAVYYGTAYLIFLIVTFWFFAGPAARKSS
jgi:hypothetical protein